MLIHMFQTSQTPNFSTTNKLFCNLGDSLLSFLAFLLITPTLCFWFIPMLTPTIAIIAILSGMAFSLYLNRNNLKYGLLIVVLLALIVVGIYQLSNLFVDTSWDGWSYHQPAVIALIKGWNPIKEPDLKLYPYLINLKDHGYLFYPLNEIDIIARQAAPEFLQKNRVVKFLWSIYAKVDNSGQDLPKIKFPLTVSQGEYNLFRYVCDTRFSGFGPLFGFTFTTFLFCTIIFLKDIFKSKELKLISLALFTILIATTLFPESWWASYIPQLWYAPVLLSFILFIMGKLRATFLLALSIFVNLAIVANARITGQHELAGLIRNNFYKILSEKPLKIYPTNICFTIPIVCHAAQYGVHISVTDSPNHCKPTANGHFQTCG